MERPLTAIFFSQSAAAAECCCSLLCFACSACDTATACHTLLPKDFPAYSASSLAHNQPANCCYHDIVCLRCWVRVQQSFNVGWITSVNLGDEILTKPQHFTSSSVFTFDNFSREIKVVKRTTAKESKTTTFSRVFHPKKSTIFSWNQSWFFGTKNEDFEQCANT